MTVIDPAALPFRQGVGLCVFNARGQVLIAERRDRPGSWQFPQGGINRGEEVEVAALRELREEIGTDKVKILARMTGKTQYIFPDWLQWRGGVFRGKYRGQEQVWFALIFQGLDSDINLSGEHDHEPPEFVNWRWDELESVIPHVVDFKRAVYHQVATAFAPIPVNLRAGA